MPEMRGTAERWRIDSVWRRQINASLQKKDANGFHSAASITGDRQTQH